MTAPSARPSIPTLYKNVRFRSKLEADWARTFDALGIEWEYEREGVYFGDVFYLPDFWLPRSRQYVEVKGILEPEDCRKIQALLAAVAPRPHTDPVACPDFPLLACLPNGRFFGWERRPGSPLSFFEFLSTRSRRVAFLRCLSCGGWWAGDDDESWRCQCCGAYDGNGLLSTGISSPIAGFPDLSLLRDLV